ncbi:unnamed protein product [Amoebophrya sp. A25]|nr:unnamed protein product [Amoebophrya sp. A25]|eukprot:GSA25T00017602001.1
MGDSVNEWKSNPVGVVPVLLQKSRVSSTPRGSRVSEAGEMEADDLLVSTASWQSRLPLKLEDKPALPACAGRGQTLMVRAALPSGSRGDAPRSWVSSSATVTRNVADAEAHKSPRGEGKSPGIARPFLSRNYNAATILASKESICPSTAATSSSFTLPSETGGALKATKKSPRGEQACGSVVARASTNKTTKSTSSPQRQFVRATGELAETLLTSDFSQKEVGKQEGGQNEETAVLSRSPAKGSASVRSASSSSRGAKPFGLGDIKAKPLQSVLLSARGPAPDLRRAFAEAKAVADARTASAIVRVVGRVSTQEVQRTTTTSNAAGESSTRTSLLGTGTTKHDKPSDVFVAQKTATGVNQQKGVSLLHSGSSLIASAKTMRVAALPLSAAVATAKTIPRLRLDFTPLSSARGSETLMLSTNNFGGSAGRAIESARSAVSSAQSTSTFSPQQRDAGYRVKTYSGIVAGVGSTSMTPRVPMAGSSSVLESPKSGGSQSPKLTAKVQFEDDVRELEARRAKGVVMGESVSTLKLLKVNKNSYRPLTRILGRELLGSSPRSSCPTRTSCGMSVASSLAAGKNIPLAELLRKKFDPSPRELASPRLHAARQSRTILAYYEGEGNDTAEDNAKEESSPASQSFKSKAATKKNDGAGDGVMNASTQDGAAPQRDKSTSSTNDLLAKLSAICIEDIGKWVPQSREGSGGSAAKPARTSYPSKYHAVPSRNRLQKPETSDPESKRVGDAEAASSLEMGAEPKIMLDENVKDASGLEGALARQGSARNFRYRSDSTTSDALGNRDSFEWEQMNNIDEQANGACGPPLQSGYIDCSASSSDLATAGAGVEDPLGDASDGSAPNHAGDCSRNGDVLSQTGDEIDLSASSSETEGETETVAIRAELQRANIPLLQPEWNPSPNKGKADGRGSWPEKKTFSTQNAHCIMAQERRTPYEAECVRLDKVLQKGLCNQKLQLRKAQRFLSELETVAAAYARAEEAQKVALRRWEEAKAFFVAMGGHDEQTIEELGSLVQNQITPGLPEIGRNLRDCSTAFRERLATVAKEMPRRRSQARFSHRERIDRLDCEIAESDAIVEDLVQLADYGALLVKAFDTTRARELEAVTKKVERVSQRLHARRSQEERKLSNLAESASLSSLALSDGTRTTCPTGRNSLFADVDPSAPTGKPLGNRSHLSSKTSSSSECASPSSGTRGGRASSRSPSPGTSKAYSQAASASRSRDQSPNGSPVSGAATPKDFFSRNPRTDARTNFQDFFGAATKTESLKRAAALAAVDDLTTATSCTRSSSEMMKIPTFVREQSRIPELGRKLVTMLPPAEVSGVPKPKWKIAAYSAVTSATAPVGRAVTASLALES